MTSDTEEPKRMNLVVEVFLYPFHFIVRAIVRLTRLLAAIGGLAIASIIIFKALVWGWPWAEDKLGEGEPFTSTWLIAFALLASLGLLATVFTKAGEAIKNTLLEIGRELRDLAKDWLPRLNAKESMADAKKDFLAIGRTFRRLFSAPYRLILPLLIIVFLTFFATRIIDADAKWKKGVTAALNSPTIVVVVPAEGDPPIPVPTPRLGTTFAIAHVEQGSLESGRGICLDDNISLPWLTVFKKALSQCDGSEPECRPDLVVKAFASIAPIRGDDGEAVDSEAQEKLNCEIANRRAEEVVDFLRLNEDYKCKEKGEWKKRPRKRYSDGDTLCQRKSRVFRFGQDDGLAFDLSYEPWQTHKAMVADKPANDGGPSPRARWPGVEFFNRSVQLTVRDYGCDPEHCARAVPAGSGATEASRRQTRAPPAATNTNAAASAAPN